MNVAIQLSSIKKYMQTEEDVRTSLRKLADMGFRIAQIQWTGAEVRPEVLADALRENGITAVSVQDYTHAILADPEYYLRLADSCGFSDITVSGIPAEEMTAEGIRRFADRIAPFHRRLTAEGKTLTFHPRWQELSEVDGEIALLRLMAESDPSLRILPDINHVIRAGLDAPDFVSSFAGRADMLHCKDMTDTSRETSHLTVAGQGCVNWPPILAAAKKAGYRYAFVEQESWDGDAFDCMNAGRQYLCSVVGE